MSRKGVPQDSDKEQEDVSVSDEAATEISSETEELSALAAAEEENKKLLDQLIRMKAEFENFRKRADRDRPALIRHGQDGVLIGLLPLYDSLLSAHEQVQAHAQAGEETEASTSEIIRGLDLMFKEFTKFFENEGIALMDAVGEPYNVDRHEVLGQVETDEYEDGTVVEVLQRGYLLRDRTLRAAKVRIAKKK